MPLTGAWRAGGRPGLKRRFWVVYDYGQGGRWVLVEARSREAITERFPELQVVERRPAWMTDEIASRLEANVIDLDRPTGLLLDIQKHRN